MSKKTVYKFPALLYNIFCGVTYLYRNISLYEQVPKGNKLKEIKEGT